MLSTEPTRQLLTDLNGYVAIITGAGGGIGAGIAQQFSAAGASLVLHFRTSAEATEKLASEIRASGREAITVQADLTNAEQCDELMSRAVKQFGRIDHLVNNAGVQPNEFLEKMSVDQWRYVIDNNTTSTFAATQAVIPHMRNNGGSITHIASIEGSHPATAHSHYCSSKAAIIMHARTAALEYGRLGIRVNSVSPGLIDRYGLKDSWPDGVNRWEDKAPLSRLGSSHDIGNACVFLASHMASWISGIDLIVDGGMSASPTW